MNCPSCGSPLHADARFCGVCGHKLGTGDGSAKKPAGQPGPGPAMASPAAAPAVKSAGQGATPAPAPSSAPKPPRPHAGGRTPAADPFIGATLNNRFKVDAKLGEGGFGAVYKGVQIATGRKVAIKL